MILLLSTLIAFGGYLELSSYYEPWWFVHLLDVDFESGIAYVSGVGGFMLVDLSDPYNPQLIGNYQLQGSIQYYNHSRFSNYAICTAREDGFYIISYENPSHPVLIYGYSPEYTSIEAVAIKNNKAYFTAHEQGIIIYDISNPGHPTFISQITGFTNAWDIKISGNYAYIADGYGGLVVLDLTSPETIVGRAGEGIIVQDISIENTLAFLAAGTQGVEIFDITVPTNPQLINTIDTNGSAFKVSVKNNYLGVASWNLIELYDVSDPLNPQFLSSDNSKSRAMGIFLSEELILVADWERLSVYQYREGDSPNIVLSRDDVIFDEIPQGQSETQNIYVQNLGTSNLIVSDIVGYNPNYSITPTSFELDVNAQIELEITYSPVGGDPLGIFTIYSNDPNDPELPLWCFSGNVPVSVGDEAPDFTLLDLNDIPHTLSDYRGNIVVLALFASW